MVHIFHLSRMRYKPLPINSRNYAYFSIEKKNYMFKSMNCIDSQYLSQFFKKWKWATLGLYFPHLCKYELIKIINEWLVQWNLCGWIYSHWQYAWFITRTKTKTNFIIFRPTVNDDLLSESVPTVIYTLRSQMCPTIKCIIK